MTCPVPQNINTDRIFFVNFSELEGRLEPEFYRPSIASYEKKIRSHSSRKLKDFALTLTGGATPPKTESDKYYSDSTNGVPFLRVQNLQTNGELLLDDCVYINKETHTGLLKRSQVSEGDLLIKITGVGRMAIASVAPAGFVGNTNQHMVVIKTGNVELSKYLAHYLNLDSIEKIASRHSTGGTRPALDYPSLKNLPIIEDLDFSGIDLALKYKQQKEQEAKDLLASIDNYLLSELGIERPTIARTENGRFFYTSYKEVIGKRLDPLAYSEQAQKIKYAIINGKYPCSSLKSLTIQEAAGDWGIDITDDYDMQVYSKCLVLRSTEFNAHHNLLIDNSKAKYRLINKKKLHSIDLQVDDLIIEKSGGSENQPVGRIAIITKNLWEYDTLCYSNFVQKIRINKNKVIPKYMYYFLRLVHNMKLTETMQSQTNGIRNLILSEYYAQQIPIPSIEKQRDIISQIEIIYNKAIELQKSAQEIINKAKQEIEAMILGE